MINALEELIDPNACIPISGISLNEIILKEDSDQSKIRKLLIKKLPDNCFAFTLDCNKKVKGKNYAQLSPYFNDSNKIGINKSCDLVIIRYKESESLIEVDLIDLKSDKIKKSQCQSQLDNSEIFIKYLLKIIDFYYGIKTESKIRKSVIYTGPIRKSLVHRGKLPYISELRYISLTEKQGLAEIYYGKIVSG